MTAELTAAAAIARLIPELTRGALQLAAELRDAVQSAHDMLAPIADEHEAAGVVFAFLADVLASTAPPPAASS